MPTSSSSAEAATSLAYNFCYSTPAGITFSEAIEGYQVTTTNTATATATQRLYCRWADAAALSYYLRTVNSYTGSLFDVIIGAAHPTWANLYVDEVDITPAPGAIGSGFGVYDYAQLEIKYAALNFVGSLIRTDGYSQSGEIITLGDSSVQYPSGLPCGPVQYLVSYLKYTVQLSRISAVPMSAIKTCLNKVNTASFSAKTGGAGAATYAAGYVLFTGMSNASRKVTTEGAEQWDITYNFNISPYDLRQEYNPRNTGATVLDRFEDTTPPKYETADFSTLGI